MGDFLVFKLAALALPINADRQCIRDSAASLSIYCKVSTVKMFITELYFRFLARSKLFFSKYILFILFVFVYRT
jgi:hypothetical protein